jgi:hypothetical protein
MQQGQAMRFDDACSAVTRVMDAIFAKDFSRFTALRTCWVSDALESIMAKQFVEIELAEWKPIVKRLMLR